MNCQDALRQMEDFRCGELDNGAVSELDLHLRSCPECARALDVTDSEDRAYEAYATELERNLEVPPQMWQKVRREISASAPESGIRRFFSVLSGHLLPRSAFLRQAAFAAAIVVLSVATTLLTLHYYRGQGMERPGERAAGRAERPRTTGSANSLEAAIQSIQRAERDYINAIAMLSTIVDKRKPSLDPQVVAEVERNLRAIDASIQATRDAYHAHPSDPELAHYMLTAYEKKVELLLELAS